MSGLTPPEIDFSQLLYNQAKEGRQQQRQRSGSSESNPYYTDEPRQLHSRGSASSLSNRASVDRSNSLHRSSRDSNPYSLDNQPTIFATSPAPGANADANYGQGQTFESFGLQGMNQGNYMDYSNSGQQQQQQGGQTDQFWTNYIQDDGQQQQQQQQSQGQQQQQQQQQQQFGQPTFQQYDQSAIYNDPSSSSTNGASTSYNPAWSQQFVQQQNGVNYGSNGEAVNGGGNGTWNGMNTMSSGSMDETTNNNSFQEELEELIRSANASRAPTPQPEDPMSHSEPQQQQQQYTSNAPSQPHSRSVSPFQPAPSPYHSTSSRANSPFMKPMSPPALVIPGTGGAPSPAPNLPPIITNQTSQPPPPRMGNQTAPANSGGLFPPANPALTGMAGISPIHPNADGPMIFVQPSTPISGLTGARGIWENALRQAAEKQKDGQGQGSAQGPSVPPPATHELSRNQSHDNANNGGGVNAMPNNAGLDPPVSPMRPRAKSDSHMGDIDRQIMMQMLAQQHMLLQQQQQEQQQAMAQQTSDAWSHMNIDAWRAMVNNNEMPPPPTVDPRHLPGQDVNPQQQQQQQQQQQPGQMPISPYGPEAFALFQQMQQQHQLSQLQAQAQAGKNRLPPLNTATDTTASAQSTSQHQSTGFSPTSLSFYQSLGIDPLSAGQLAGTASAPFFTTSFQDIPQTFMPTTAGVPGAQSYLGAPDMGMGPRRRSFAEGTSHHAAGAGTPGYGVGLSAPTPYARHAMGHRRGIQSEDFGKGWGLGQGGSTTDFLQSITANDGSLLPPSRGRSHSRQSSASSNRSASPALSISSHGSSMSHHSPRMSMPDEQEVVGGKARSKMPKMKVTSMATEVASSARRTNEGAFICPIPGCGSTFTRHFNLKGHLRSHNDERPYKCLYDGCPKSIVGFARQHDCKRHMLLHEGLRPFECEGCGKKFARLDALTRHHKSEQGQECAVSHPLPVNPDGSAMSESQYKSFKGIKDDAKPGKGAARKKPSTAGITVKKEEGEDHSGLSDIGDDGGGMSEYDVAA